MAFRDGPHLGDFEMLLAFNNSNSGLERRIEALDLPITIDSAYFLFLSGCEPSADLAQFIVRNRSSFSIGIAYSTDCKNGYQSLSSALQRDHIIKRKALSTYRIQFELREPRYSSLPRNDLQDCYCTSCCFFVAIGLRAIPVSIFRLCHVRDSL